MLHRKLIRRRRAVLAVVAALVACPYETCISTDLAKRFREAYAPGLIAGLSAAITTPTDPDTGIRQAWAALIDGLGALLNVQPASTKTGSSSQSGS